METGLGLSQEASLPAGLSCLPLPIRDGPRQVHRTQSTWPSLRGPGPPTFPLQTGRHMVTVGVMEAGGPGLSHNLTLSSNAGHRSSSHLEANSSEPLRVCVLSLLPLPSTRVMADIAYQWSLHNVNRPCCGCSIDVPTEPLGAVQLTSFLSLKRSAQP